MNWIMTLKCIGLVMCAIYAFAFFGMGMGVAQEIWEDRKTKYALPIWRSFCVVNVFIVSGIAALYIATQLWPW
ncbi:MAG: hypothetical protein IJZ68_08685 [Bacteroidaceae bacterium]|nr:hypothetical protein [Bacteroidaceae bacterium]